MSLRLDVQPAGHALRIAATVTALVFVCIVSFVPPSQNDFWLQAAIGRLIVETVAIPRTVLFPFTPVRDNAFNAHEWLPSVLFYWLDKNLGYDALLFVLGGSGLVLFGLCCAIAYRLSRSLGATLCLACLALAVQNYRHYLRPELIALMLFAMELLALTAYRASRDWRWLLGCVALALVWANSHGSFLVGIVTASIFAVGEGVLAWRTTSVLNARARNAWLAGAPYAAAGVGMFLVSAINPLGWELLYLGVALQQSEVAKAHVLEWYPTWSTYFIHSRGFLIFVAASAITLTVVVLYRRQITATEVLLLIGFFALALSRSRFVVWFGFIALVVCARLIGSTPTSARRERFALSAALALSAAAVALAAHYGNAYGAYPYFTRSTSFTDAMRTQLEHPTTQGNVLNSYELGAELVYRGYPKLRPSIDSRIDSYGDAYFMMHNNLFFDEAALRRFIAEFNVRHMLLLWRDFNRIRDMPGIQSDWLLQFGDHKAVLLARRDPGT